jgi:hypothetical protein
MTDLKTRHTPHEIDNFLDNIKNADQRPFINGLTLPNGQYLKGKDTSDVDTNLIGYTSDNECYMPQGLVVPNNTPLYAKDTGSSNVELISLDDNDYIESNQKRLTRYVAMDKTQVLSAPGSSDVNWTDLDLTASTSANTFAVNLNIQMRDSGSAANNTYISVSDDGGATAYLIAKGGHINDQYIYATGVVGCSTGQVVEYKIEASGSGTADAYIYLLGYFEYIK